MAKFDIFCNDMHMCVHSDRLTCLAMVKCKDLMESAHKISVTAAHAPSSAHLLHTHKNLSDSFLIHRVYNDVGLPWEGFAQDLTTRLPDSKALHSTSPLLACFTRLHPTLGDVRLGCNCWATETVLVLILRPREVWGSVVIASAERCWSLFTAPQHSLTPLCDCTWPPTLWLSCSQLWHIK